MVKKILFPTLSLLAICAVVSLMLAFTNNLTAEKIQEQNELALSNSMKSVLTEATEFTAVKDGVYSAYKDGEQIGFAFNMLVKGYGGDISVMIGITGDGKIAGVSVLSHNETPGLGAKTADSGFLSQFTGKPAEQLSVGNGVDAVTGATISSTAVTSAVNLAVEEYKALTGKEGE